MFQTRLPGGYFHTDGSLHLDVQLRTLCGKDEELLSRQKADASAALVTAILAKCIRSLGSICTVTEDITRGLLVADRQFLLLKLREHTFGAMVQGTTVCPEPGCRQKVDIEFNLSDIPVKPLSEKNPRFTLLLPDDAAIKRNSAVYTRVVFRLPNGSDQEVLFPFIGKNDAYAQDLLLERCIEQIDEVKAIDRDFIRALLPETKKSICEEMAKKAPQLETVFEARCTECGTVFEFPFDIYRFFLKELQTGPALLYQEVHYLAFHYHWSEREIMKMPREKRRHYISILAAEIERINNESY